MSLRSLSPWARLCSAALVFALAGCPDPVVVVPDAPATPDAGDAGPRDGGPRDGGMPDGGGPVCGDGVVNGTEVCDDDNTTANDGCSATCTEEAGWTCDGADPTVCTEDCGDGMVVGDEAGANGCDDGNTAAGDGCATCMVEMGWACTGAPSTCTPDCGDGAINGSEVCDDGDNLDNDGCSMACQVETGWTCDTAEPTVCSSVCGDGTVAMGAETCDDSNTTAGDGCSDLCATETGWDCSTGTCAPICGDTMTIAPETCDDGNAVTEICDYGVASCTVCDATCTSTAGATRVCGDMMTNAPDEMCDDGNVVTETACAYGTATCTACEADCTATLDLTGNVCGDTVVDAVNETCDDGNLTPGDGCDATCQREAVCGDGAIEGLEICDDGNILAADGCSAACVVETGFSCFGTGPSTCVPVTPIAAPGSSITLTGSIDATDPTWTRASATCTAGTNVAYRDLFYVINNTATAQSINLTATWGGDGFVHVFRSPFNAATLAGCVTGDDDFDPDGAGPLGALRGSQILGATIAPGEVLMVVASTFAATTATGAYTIDVATTDCGNGTRGLGETCDDANRTAADGCSSACQLETGYTCTTATPNVCTLNCGNGTLQTGETCDDSNTTSADGCSNVCAIEAGFVCSGAPSVCRPIVCGDTFRDAPETCDDGNTTAADGCSATCAVEADFSCTTATPNVCTPNAYLTTTITAACRDMTAATAVAGATGDDVISASAALPFSFTYFGTAFTNYAMSSNGYLQLLTAGSGTSAAGNTALPATGTPNSTIAAFWDDLVNNAGGGASVLTTGTGPSRVFVLQWANYRNFFATSSESITFQAMLYETTGVIEFHYCSATGTSTTTFGSSASIGLENADGTSGVQQAFNTTAAIATGRAFRFTPR